MHVIHGQVREGDLQTFVEWREQEESVRCFCMMYILFSVVFFFSWTHALACALPLIAKAYCFLPPF